MATVSARIVSALHPLVTEVFGVMGNGNAHFLDAVMASPSLHYTAVRHEAGAVAAADAYFRAGGRLAVATTTYGAGFTNALTPLAEAVQAQIPLVLVVGDAPTTGPRPWDVDQAMMAQALGATTFRVAAERARAVTTAAVEHALRHRTAVVLAIPYDLAGAEAAGEALIEGVAVECGSPSRREPTAADVDRAALLLASAERPLVLAGRGAWLSGAKEAAGKLADRIGALTATSGLAQGFFSGSPASLGVAGGWASERSARLIREADVVLVLGARLNQFTLRFGHCFGPDARVIQVDVSSAPTSPAVTDFLPSDARLAAEALLAAVECREGNRRWSVNSADDARGAHDQRHDGDPLAPDGRLDPRSLCRTLDRLLPADRTIVQDGGHFIGWAPGYLHAAAPNRLIMVGTAYQTIGLGFPSAVGAARALPHSTIVLCTGDGGGLMALADLESVIRTARRAVIVVFNDAAYGAEIHQYAVRGIDSGPMLIDEVDFAAVGTALGAMSRTIRTLEDLTAVEGWLASDDDGVLLLDCKISRQVVAPYMQEIVAVATGAR